jgi:hypothetical protein
MCLKCRENGTYCKYSPTQRKGKRKAEPTVRPNDQDPTRITGNPGYFSHDNDPFWQHHPAVMFGYDLNQHPGLDITSYAGLDMAAMPPASLPSGSSSASPDMDYSLLHLDQDTIFFDVDTAADHSIYDQYRHIGHSRSNSFDTATTMSRTNSLQAARDLQQMYDLHQTPSSTPPGTGTNPPPFLPAQQPHMDSTTVDGMYDQQSSMVGTGLHFGKTCNCFMNCQTYLDALRNMDMSNVPGILNLSDTAMQSCLCLILCPHCRDSIGADTVSVIASIIEKASSLYKHLFTRINKEVTKSGARPKMLQPTRGSRDCSCMDRPRQRTDGMDRWAAFGPSPDEPRRELYE